MSIFVDISGPKISEISTSIFLTAAVFGLLTLQNARKCPTFLVYGIENQTSSTLWHIEPE